MNGEQGLKNEETLDAFKEELTLKRSVSWHGMARELRETTFTESLTL